MIKPNSNHNDVNSFAEFREKVRSSEVLSASFERLANVLQFTGRICVILQNGRVLKAGYEESYFRQGKPEPALSPMR